MAAPVGAWGLLVIGVDLDRDGSGRVESFIGFWTPRDTPHPPELGTDDVIMRLTPCGDAAAAEGGEGAAGGGAGAGDVAGDRVDIEMLLGARDGWHVVGRWPGLGTDWPDIVGPTAAVVMGLAEVSVVAGMPWPFALEPVDGPSTDDEMA